jgi:hypothetical protein
MATQNIVLEASLPEQLQSNAQQRQTIEYIIQPTDLRVWDDLSSLLPATAAADDLGLVDGTYATSSPLIQTSDAKATTVTQRARFMWCVPPEYDLGQTIDISFHAGMETTVSDTTATIDAECYVPNKSGGIGSDLVTTAALTINDLAAGTYGARRFTIDGSSLAVGDTLDIRFTIAITDGATGTAVIGSIGEIAIRCDIRMG